MGVLGGLVDGEVGHLGRGVDKRRVLNVVGIGAGCVSDLGGVGGDLRGVEERPCGVVGYFGGGVDKNDLVLGNGLVDVEGGVFGRCVVVRRS